MLAVDDCPLLKMCVFFSVTDYVKRKGGGLAIGTEIVCAFMFDGPQRRDLIGQLNLTCSIGHSWGQQSTSTNQD